MLVRGMNSRRFLDRLEENARPSPAAGTLKSASRNWRIISARPGTIAGAPGSIDQLADGPDTARSGDGRKLVHHVVVEPHQGDTGILADRHRRRAGMVLDAAEETGADDDGGADPAQEIGEIAEEEIAHDHRAHELHVLERRHDVGRRIGERAGHEIVAGAAQHPEAAEVEDVAGAFRRLPDEGQDQEHAEAAHDRAVDRRGLRRVDGGDQARQDLVDRIAGRAQQREQGCPLEDGAARLDQDQHAHETHAERHHVRARGALPQNHPGQRQDQKRRHHRNRGGLAERYVDDGEEARDVGCEQHGRARELRTEPPRTQHAEPETGHEEDQHVDEMPEGACPRDLQGAVVGAEELREATHDREQQAGAAHEEDAGQNALAGRRARS
ncbi:hypothetical protein OSTOST_13603 [Ostertagia ostertagi]